MKRTLIRTAALLVMALAMTACAAQSEPMASPSPTTEAATAEATQSAQPSPGTDTNQPATQNNTQDGAQGASAQPATLGVEDADTARRASEELKDTLEQLSEVHEAHVVIAGRQAVVGLSFDTEYQAGVDDRMQEMVRDRLDGVVSGIERLAVTEDANRMERIDQLEQQLQNATDLTAIENDISALINQIEGGEGNQPATDNSSQS